jgi:site-specific DNA-methyltransferase (adenine-specific)
MSKTIDIRIGDCREILKTLPDKSVHCCVTSPPYYKLRRYCTPGTPEAEYELGQEGSPEEYVSKLVEVFREVRRALRDDGVFWLNISDKLGTKGPLGIPWKVCFALQEDGWRLVQEIIWQKNNCMPESAIRRCTKSHEYMFLFAKKNKYYFDGESIKEPSVSDHSSGNGFKRSARVSYQNPDGSARGNDNQWEQTTTRNKRDVWQINTVPYKKAHFATFPPKLVIPCILAGTSEKGVCSECGAPYKRITEKSGQTEHGGLRKRADAPGAEVSESSVFRTGLINTQKTVGWQPSCTCNAPSIPATVLDPFGGSGTVGQVCNQLGRDAILIELNPEYKRLIEERINEKPKGKKKKTVKHLEKVTLQQNLATFFN